MLRQNCFTTKTFNVYEYHTTPRQACQVLIVILVENLLRERQIFINSYLTF